MPKRSDQAPGIATWATAAPSSNGITKASASRAATRRLPRRSPPPSQAPAIPPKRPPSASGRRACPPSCSHPSSSRRSKRSIARPGCACTWSPSELTPPGPPTEKPARGARTFRWPAFPLTPQTTMNAKRRIPKVRVAGPPGRPLQLRYRDPVTRKQVRISTGTYDAAEAETQRQQLQARLTLGLPPERKNRRHDGPIGWDEFRHRYADLHLATLRAS